MSKGMRVTIGFSDLEKISDYSWRIPRRGAMRVDGILYGSESIIKKVVEERAAEQVMNVATLPGIVGASLAMPDAHWGYGFPIGGVAAFDAEEGVVSPGGVGYDINCGVRMLATRIDADDVVNDLRSLASMLFSRIPSGLGSRGSIKLSRSELLKVAKKGARWAVEQGMGTTEDIEFTEEGGCLEIGDLSMLSDRALQRGTDQVGTLGSGNHFIEIQRVDEIFDQAGADAYGLRRGQLVVMLHSGSRGFGYQICDDFLKTMAREAVRAGIELPDRQLACAPLKSSAAGQYLDAMGAAANYAWANRQVMAHNVREVFAEFFSTSPQSLGMRLVYDVCHNIAKRETHLVDGREQKLVVHRKGATRAFGPGERGVPSRYTAVGQPVLIPGDMGRASYVLSGTKSAMTETFGSSCHGAGRVLSRKAALKLKSSDQVRREMEQRGIAVFSAGKKTLAEEMPEAYKDVDEVVDSVAGAGLAKRVARMVPLAVVKG